MNSPAGLPRETLSQGLVGGGGRNPSPPIGSLGLGEGRGWMGGCFSDPASIFFILDHPVRLMKAVSGSTMKDPGANTGDLFRYRAVCHI